MPFGSNVIWLHQWRRLGSRRAWVATQKQKTDEISLPGLQAKVYITDCYLVDSLLFQLFYFFGYASPTYVWNKVYVFQTLKCQRPPKFKFVIMIFACVYLQLEVSHSLLRGVQSSRVVSNHTATVAGFSKAQTNVWSVCCHNLSHPVNAIR